MGLYYLGALPKDPPCPSPSRLFSVRTVTAGLRTWQLMVSPDEERIMEKELVVMSLLLT